MRFVLGKIKILIICIRQFGIHYLFICLLVESNIAKLYLLFILYKNIIKKCIEKKTYLVARQASCHTDRACAACRTRECTSRNSSWTKYTPEEKSNSQSYFSQSKTHSIYPRHPRVLSLFQMTCRTTVHIPYK